MPGDVESIGGAQQMAIGSCEVTGQAQIGETAGLVWQALSESGPMTAAKLVREVGIPRDLVMQAIGWLAREDKLMIDEGSRSRTYALQD
jgi:hypothetical protein